MNREVDIGGERLKALKLTISAVAIVLFIVPNVFVNAQLLKTLESFNSTDNAINNFNVGDVDIEVVEDFKPPEKWDGNEHKKIVFIENLSKSEALIRVNIMARWVDKDGKPIALDASPKVVKLYFTNIDESPGWIKGSDGYYYYNMMVPTGSKTVPLLDGVKILIEDKGTQEIYKGNKLIIDIKSEAVQATKDGYNAAWSNITDSNIRDILDKLCIR
ncbi:hypothetical protein ACQPU1_09825 [Clostridium paraputrificum]|uniref:hypothetical protein n=1 Tax=Clostridium TaxID=1485 RepID=UPI003D348492